MVAVVQGTPAGCCRWVIRMAGSEHECKRIDDR
jgi:hypothetical protein